MASTEYETAQYARDMAWGMFTESNFRGVIYNYTDLSRIDPGRLAKMPDVKPAPQRLITSVLFGVYDEGVFTHDFPVPESIAKGEGHLTDLKELALKANPSSDDLKHIFTVEPRVMERYTRLGAPYAALMAAKIIIGEGKNRSLTSETYGLLFMARGMLNGISAFNQLQIDSREKLGTV